MKHFDFATQFHQFLSSIKVDDNLNNWIFKGKTDIKYGSPGGSWDGVDGFLFKNSESNSEIIIRSNANKKDKSYIVIESVVMESQLYNIDLTNPKKFISENGISTLFESYAMTVGYGRRTNEQVKNVFKHFGVETNIICTIKEQSPDWKKLAISLLNWGNIREKVKSYLIENTGTNISSKDNFQKIQDSSSNYKHLNQILFGPPGTGKTYNTINKALEIIGESIEGKTRKEIKDLFDAKMKEGQIIFTTFHQSMSYEDFIEGIKPLKPSLIDTHVKYDIVDGIFKKLCLEAKAKNKFNVKLNGVVLPLTKDLFEEFYDSYSEALPKHENLDSSVKLKTKEEYPFELFRNTAGSIVVRAGQKRTNSTISFNELSQVLFNSKTPTYKSYEQVIIDKILEGKEFSISEIDNSQKKYVLIIDEINRGNVSQIFGELITLIEEDKRLGKDEALEVTLPYSKEKFSVPANLYIIGTMNTADRSVEALDAALRRRFSFTEMPSEPRFVNSYFVNLYIQKFLEMYEVSWDDDPWMQFEYDYKDLIVDSGKYDETTDVEIQNMIYHDNKNTSAELETFFEEKGIEFLPVLILEKINKRIGKLLDKDHQIGHSYFMQVTNLGDLKSVFQNKIIPLLQEYFFGDYGKIGLVLGQGFFEHPIESGKHTNLFASFYDYSAEEFEERIVYKTKNVTLLPDDEFKAAINALLNK